MWMVQQQKTLCSYYSAALTVDDRSRILLGSPEVTRVCMQQDYRWTPERPDERRPNKRYRAQRGRLKRLCVDRHQLQAVLPCSILWRDVPARWSDKWHSESRLLTESWTAIYSPSWTDRPTRQVTRRWHQSLINMNQGAVPCVMSCPPIITVIQLICKYSPYNQKTDEQPAQSTTRDQTLKEITTKENKTNRMSVISRKCSQVSRVSFQ